MTDSTKALLGGLIASITIIGSLLVMSDCSKVTARYNGETIENCVRSGGSWLTTNGVTNEGLCMRRAK